VSTITPPRELARIELGVTRMRLHADTLIQDHHRIVALVEGFPSRQTGAIRIQSLAKCVRATSQRYATSRLVPEPPFSKHPRFAVTDISS
jgi:hypothetical protein